MGFTELLTIIFIILKVTGTISWSWWLVLLLELIAVVLYMGIFVFAGKKVNDTDRVIVTELQERVDYLQNKNKEYIETIQVLKKDISKKKQIISELREE